VSFVELLAGYLAGLSLFFTGVSGISENLRRMSGRRFRLLLSRATNHPVLAGLLGAVMGALTQSSSVVAFILKGMVAGGMLTLRRALMVLACANIGTALLVFAAAVDIHLPILLLIGASGLLLASKLWARLTPGFAAAMSLGLLLFGLEMMKQAFRPVGSSSGAVDVSKFLNYFPDAAFFASTAVRTVVHSSSAVAAIAVTASKGGALGDFPAMLGMAGLGLGSAIVGWFFSRKLVGVPRQISVHQAMTNLLAGLVIAVSLTVERVTHLPLLLALMRLLGHSSAGRIAMMYFLFNLVIVAVAIATLPWAPEWLAKTFPPSPEEDLSQPKYLHSGALESPETALDLVALEQLRVVNALELYLKSARGEVGIKFAELHGAAERLGVEIEAFLDSLIRTPITTSLAARVISFQRKQETLRSLEENVFAFAETLEGHQGAAALAGQMVEALDTITMTAADALATNDAGDVEMLMRLTDDRGGMMERLRNRLSLDESQTVAEVAALHYATTLFERNVWLLRQLALWIREDSRVGG
jgi:phosphate:Na+ symporter